MPPAPAKRPTIKDVAQKAGVSIATVSFVLNNRPGQVISERVRRRVWKVAEQLSYHPSANAAGLARKRTHNVAIAFYRDETLVANHFYSFVVQGAIKEAIRREFNLLFSYLPHEYRGIADLPKVFREHNTEGALFIREVSPKLIEDIASRGIPVVAIDHFPLVESLHSLEIDSRRGGELAAEHLLKNGHQRFAFVGAEFDRPSIAARLDGFHRALADRGIPFSLRRDVLRCDLLWFESGRRMAPTLLTREQRPTGIFCANDELAGGVLRAARELGLSVPRDLSVIGFDDIKMSEYTDPPLTTIGLDKEALGSHAMRQLLELVEHRDGVPLREVIDVEIVIRQSTGPAPG